MLYKSQLSEINLVSSEGQSTVTVKKKKKKLPAHNFSCFSLWCIHLLLSTSQLSCQDPLSASFFNVLFINFFKYCTGLHVTYTWSIYHKVHISTGPLIRFKDTALLYVNCSSLNLQKFRKMWHFSSFFFFSHYVILINLSCFILFSVLYCSSIMAINHNFCLFNFSFKLLRSYTKASELDAISPL